MNRSPGSSKALPVNLLKGAVVAAFVTLLGWSHAVVAQAGWTYTGPLAFPAHLFELVMVLGLVWIATALGRSIFSPLAPAGVGALEELLFSIGLGLGGVSTLLLGMGMVTFRPWSVAALFAVLALSTRGQWRPLWGLVTEIANQTRKRIRRDTPSALTAGVLFLVAFFLLVFAWAGPADWDSLMYHLEIPQLFLEKGRLHLPEDNLHVSRVGMIHMLYVPLLAAGSEAGPALLNAILALLLPASMMVAGRRFFAESSGLLGAVLLWGSSTILLVAITPRVDAALALYAFLALLALLQAVTDETPGRPFLLAAILLGLAVGIKFHGLVVAAAAVPLVMTIGVGRWTGPGRVRALALFGSVAGIVALPWFVKNWALLGAPLYPFLASPVLPPWIAAIAGSSSIPPSVDPGALSLIWDLHLPFNLRDAFLSPGRLTIEVEGKWYFLGPALLLLPLVLFFRKNRALVWLTVSGLAYCAILLGAFPATNPRYLLPAIPPLTLAVAHALLATVGRLRRKDIRWAVVGIVTGVTLIPPASLMIQWLPETPAVEKMVGTASRRWFLARHPDLSVRTMVPIVTFAEDSLPENTRLLMLMEARGFYFEPKVLQDNKGTNWAFLLETDAPSRCLAGTGITHVLLNTGSVNYYAQRGMNLEALGFAGAFRSFASRCLTPVYQTRHVTIFEIRPLSPAP